MAEELAYRDEAAAGYDRAFAQVSTHFVPFLLRAARLAATGGGEDGAVLGGGAGLTLREGQLHAKIAIGLLMESLHDRQRDRSLGGRQLDR